MHVSAGRNVAILPQASHQQDHIPMFLQERSSRVLGIPVLIWSAVATTWAKDQPEGWILIESILRLALQEQTNTDLARLLAIDPRTIREVVAHCRSTGWVSALPGGKLKTSTEGRAAMDGFIKARRHNIVYLIQDGFTGELLAACDQIREVALLPSGKGETAAYEAEFMPGHRVPFTVLPTIDARPVAPVPRQFAQLPRHRLLMSSPPSQLELRVFDESKREGFLPTRIRHLTAELSEPPVADCLLEHKAREIRAHEQLAMRRQEALELIPATPLTGAGTPFLADWTLSSELQDRLFAYKVERGQSEGKNNPSAHVEVMQSLRRLGLAVVDWLITTKVGAADQHSVESLCRSFQRGDGIERLRMEYPEFWSLGRPLNYEIIAAAIGGEADQVLPWLAGNAFIGRIPRPVVFELINGEVLKNAAKVDAALPGELRAAEATWTQLLEELKQNIDQFEAVPNEGERSGEEEVQSQYEARRGGVQTEPEAPPASATESLTQPG